MMRPGRHFLYAAIATAGRCIIFRRWRMGNAISVWDAMSEPTRIEEFAYNPLHIALLFGSGIALLGSRRLRAHRMTWQAQCYPKTVDDLKPILEHVKELGADHINLQPDVRPLRPWCAGMSLRSDSANVAVTLAIAPLRRPGRAGWRSATAPCRSGPT